MSFVRGMVNGDVNEITYMTGDGKPRIGDATLITSGTRRGFREHGTNSECRCQMRLTCCSEARQQIRARLLSMCHT